MLDGRKSLISLTVFSTVLLLGLQKVDKDAKDSVPYFRELSLRLLQEGSFMELSWCRTYDGLEGN